MNELDNIKEQAKSYTMTIKNSINKIEEIRAIVELEEIKRDNFFEKEDYVYSSKSFNNSGIINADFDLIISSLKKLLEIDLVNFDLEWEKYNNQYKNLLLNNINNFNSMFSSYTNNSIKIYGNFENYINNTLTFLENMKNIFSSNSNELFEHFKYNNKNYIIFGKNGSGKTTLLHNVKSSILNQNSFVIPARKNLKCNTNSVYQGDRSSTDYSSIIVKENAIDVLCVKMIMRENEELRIAHQQNKIFDGKTIIEKFYEVFESLDLERKVIIENEVLYLYDEDIPKYLLTSGSDGEKTIVLMLMIILLLPNNAYIFIDEPENHLNGSLMIELYNKLEEIRPDLKFIYITHNIDFIESRHAIELIYLEKTRKINNWKFKKIENFENIKPDIIMKIEGSKKPLLFCEGDTSSIDYKVYSCIYKEYSVLPVSSCTKVIESVKSINDNNDRLIRQAYGILDNDFRETNEIEQLKSSKIFVLEYNEIENLLLKKNIIQAINLLYANKNMDEIYSYVIDYVESNKSNIFNDFLNKVYRQIIKSKKITYTENIETKIDEINEANKQEILEKLNLLSKNIDKLVTERKYDDLIDIVSGKFLIKGVLTRLGFMDLNSFISFVINQIIKNSEFKDLIISELPDIS